MLLVLSRTSNIDAPLSTKAVTLIKQISFVGSSDIEQIIVMVEWISKYLNPNGKTYGTRKKTHHLIN